jgi:hypothetical protein
LSSEATYANKEEMAWTYWFDSRFSLRVHCVQCVLILAAVILTIVRIAMPAPFTTRAHMMALAMVGKRIPLCFAQEHDFNWMVIAGH